ncbi:MAG: MFS transporter [Thermoplasmata archaeon]
MQKSGSRYPLEYFKNKSNYRWYILTVVLLGAFMSALDLNLMNIINPELEHVFHQQLFIVEWATIAYQLTLTSLLPVLGRVSDIIGRKKFYNIGFVIFIIGSGMVGLGLSIQWIIGWRILQAVGATFLQSNSIAIISANFPGNERGKAIGIQGAVQATGMAIGPSFGGFLIQYVSWNYAFYINVPVGIVGTILALLILPESKSEAGYEKVDYVGAALFTSFLAIFLFNFSMSSSKGYPLIQMYVLYLVSIILLIAFIFHGRKIKNPIIDFSLFKNIEYVAGNFAGLISYLLIGGTMFIVPFYLEYVLGYKPSLAGTLLVIIPAFMGVGTPISGALSDKMGSYKLTITGFILMTISILLLSNVYYHTSIFEIIFLFLILGLGMGIFTAPNNSSIMGMSPPGKLSLVGGFLNMMRSLGLIFGVSIATFVYESYVLNGYLEENKTIVLSAFTHAMFILFIFSIIGLILTLIKRKESKEKITVLPEIG